MTGPVEQVAAGETRHWRVPGAGWIGSYSRLVNRRLLELLLTLQGLGAFTLITLGVMCSKWNMASGVIRPLIRTHLLQTAVRLLPMVVVVSGALGLVVIGQSVSLLTRVGAQSWVGTVMVPVVIRELGPLLTAFLVLARSGTTNVVALGTARAEGEVESLEAIGVDPVHYLVVPRVIGLALGVFALTIYLILGVVLSGYIWAFLQDVPLTLEDYFEQVTSALRELDFVLLGAKTLSFGAIVAIVTSYYGLAHPLRLEDLSQATVRAVGQSILLCIVAELVFIGIYLVV